MRSIVPVGKRHFSARLIQLICIQSLVALASAATVSGDTAARRRCELLNVTYAPCHCDFYDEWAIDGYFVTCVDVESASLIQQAFNNSPVMDHVQFYVLLGRFSALPAHLLADKRVLGIDVKCENTSVEMGPVDLDAFEASRDLTESVTIDGCNLNRLNFDFLEDFTALKQIVVMQSSVINLQHLPMLPSFRLVNLFQCRELVSWYDPTRTPSLQSIYITGTGILEHPATSAFIAAFHDSLIELKLHSNELKELPDFVRTFTKLKIVDLWNNTIASLKADSLTVSSPLERLLLSWNNVDAIEANAFRGDFSQTEIRLDGNRLTRFDSAIFRPILETMARVPDSNGTIFLSDYDPEESRALYGANDFDCGCSISWLLYENRHLLDHIRNGICSNGTRFEEMDYRAYSECYAGPADSPSARAALSIHLFVLSTCVMLVAPFA